MNESTRYKMLRQTWITRHPARRAAYDGFTQALDAWHPFDADCDRAQEAHLADPVAHLRAAHEVAVQVDEARTTLARVEADLGTRFDEAAREIGFPAAAAAAAPSTDDGLLIFERRFVVEVEPWCGGWYRASVRCRDREVDSFVRETRAAAFAAVVAAGYARVEPCA